MENQDAHLEMHKSNNLRTQLLQTPNGAYLHQRALRIAVERKRAK